MKLSCIIVDDEPLAIDVIESYVQKLDYVHLMGAFRNALEAFEFLQRAEVDLIFLDIQMPKLTGLDFLRSIKNPPKVIITTAFREHALEGFELEATDYLLKPFSFERFLKAIAKLSPPIEKERNMSKDFVFFRADKKMVKVKLDEILYIESIKDYISVNTTTREILTQQKISSIEEQLSDHQFLRIHRSFIINIDKVEAFSTSVVEIGKHHLPIGRNYKEAVFKCLSS